MAQSMLDPWGSRTEPGPVAAAAATTLDHYADAGILDRAADGLLMAHVISLATRLDDPLTAAYGLASVSRELREVYRDLAARKAAHAAATGPGLDLLGDDDDGAGTD